MRRGERQSVVALSEGATARYTERLLLQASELSQAAQADSQDFTLNSNHGLGRLVSQRTAELRMEGREQNAKLPEDQWERTLCVFD